MLGTLSTHAAAPAARRVDPAAALRAPGAAPEAAGPPRRAAPDTAAPEAVAGALSALARSRATPSSVFAARVEEGEAEGSATSREAASALPPAAPPRRSAGPAAVERAAGASAGFAAAGPEATPSAASDPSAGPRPASSPAAEVSAPRRADPLRSGLSEEDLAVVAELEQRDREVREHEMAHVTAGRPWAGPAVYLYQTGPDGRRYAIGGFAPIDVSPIEGNPEATAAKMRIVIESALAAQPPSPADRHVAALAQARLQAALAAISEVGRLERQGDEAGAEAARQTVSTRI
ncbi:putative metalloprotease CJM1_0395 family protein [Albimonas sp. CAU 1670]|uniref:putative metalloprotease CJM1_0395 family protein n=1 Tax=Albimonas sp. CAU 1670 TaxID=3032599 RepID=UPI0023DA9066|nr:putative metalloprotease CJM1_0395 family protein [Albimonas sp. CAU 1670]MDF2234898.1 putative metalloprotease CJM1_0395 family protein [Albimonas sp. CAU 1670]